MARRENGAIPQGGIASLRNAFRRYSAGRPISILEDGIRIGSPAGPGEKSWRVPVSAAATHTGNTEQ